MGRERTGENGGTAYPLHAGLVAPACAQPRPNAVSTTCFNKALFGQKVHKYERGKVDCVRALGRRAGGERHHDRSASGFALDLVSDARLLAAIHRGTPPFLST